jgi:hypothetical protein
MGMAVNRIYGVKQPHDASYPDPPYTTFGECPNETRETVFIH